ncbi:MAG: UDP-glucuronic acid decarboxylase family protein [Hydrogenobacter sp.]|uniref:UDP-glucuronic acid decarboxylase family protein n=1 Tax=Hydrogenobacter thermophilus TaxID=940 RepID=UPI0030F68ABC
MRVLITGAAGFIGSHLCERFLKEGFEVIGMDNFITGSPDNIAHLFGHPKFKFLHYNVINYIYVEGSIDIVLHFACPASPVDYMSNPIHTMKVDSLGTLNTLGLAKLKKARYIFASTSEVYGDPFVHPQPETYWGYVNPVGPRSVYDEAKRFSEAMCMAYYREHGIDVRILRIFNTYGPRMRTKDGRVIPNFITQALSGEPITVYGKGEQTRSFCYIDDLVEGILRASLKDGLSGEVINLGNPEEVKIINLAMLIVELTKSSSEIIFTPQPPDDPKRRCPDITKAKELLSWEPKFSLREGLENTISWFKKKLRKNL